MEILTILEFLEKLKTNTLKSGLVLEGVVKKSDNDTEVLYSRKGDFEHWITIPSTMIDKVIVWKAFQKEDQTFAVVKLHLKEATSPEGIVFQKLLNADKPCEMDSCHGRYGCSCSDFGHHHCGSHGMDHDDTRKGDCGSKHNWLQQCGI